MIDNNISDMLDSRTHQRRTSENTATALINAFDDMAFLVDADRNVLIMNDTLLANIGKKACEVIGTSIYDHAPLPWQGNYADELDAIEETRAPVRSEVKVYGCTVELRGFPVFDDDGCIAQYAVFLRDITQQRRLQQQLLQSEMLRLELQNDRDLLTKQKKFVSMVSHELRNPLTTIRSSMEILELHYDDLTDERREVHFQRINEQVETMTAMLEDLLTFRRAESENFKFDAQPVYAGETCRAIFENIMMNQGVRHIFTFIDEGPTDPVYMDVNLLRHILENLLSNAIKYTPRGGEIRLQISEEIDDVVIHLSDAGIGIPENEQARLFEPFFRAGNATRIKGTGLGLSIARTCVEAHGGVINFQSVENEGTTFIIHLPRRPE